MPVAPDPSSGRIFIWITACFLFTCVLAGGGCLVEYMILPASEVPPWIPLLGFTLVSLPWVFWLLTFLYRILSRCCGCRFGFGVAREGSRGGNSDGARAPGEANNNNNNNGMNRTLSAASHESQLPLAKSMA